MRNILLAMLGAAALSAPALSGEPAEKPIKPLEEVVKRERVLNRIEFEKYDEKTEEVVMWACKYGKFSYRVKKEFKAKISKEDRDGKKELLCASFVVMENGKPVLHKNFYAIDCEKPILLGTNAFRKSTPEEINEGMLPDTLDIKRPAVRIEDEHYDFDSIRIEPIFYLKGELVTMRPLLSKGVLVKKKLKLEDKLKGDRKADFSILNYDNKKGKLVEVIQDYDIGKDNKFELRVVTERVVPDSEIHDYNESLKYKLIPIKDAKVDYQGMKITKAYFDKGNIVMKIGEKTGTSKFDPVKHYGGGILPDFVFSGNGKKHYARVNRKTLQVEVYVNEKGKVDFSNDMFEHVPRIYTEKEKKDII